jgi:hypothetical protein
VTNNKKFVIFWNWKLENNENATINMYAKPIPGANEKKPTDEEISMTCFIPMRAYAAEDENPMWQHEANRAISGTNKGRVIIWDEDQFSDLESDEHRRSVLKVIDLAPDKGEEASGGGKGKAGKKVKPPAINIVTVVDK